MISSHLLPRQALAWAFVTSLVSCTSLPGGVVSTELPFATSNQNMWGTGSSSSLDKKWSDFLFPLSGGDTVKKLGLTLPYSYTGTVGLEPHLQISSGSVDVNYPIKVNASLPDTVATKGSFSINTADWTHLASSISTSGPEAHFKLDAVLQFTASIGEGSLAPLGYELLHIPKFSLPINERRTLVDVGSGSSGFEVSVGPFGTLNVDAPESLKLTSSSLLPPELAKLKAVGQGDANFLNLAVDLDGLVVSAFGLPPTLLGGSYSIAPELKLEYELLNLTANLGLRFAQAFTFEPTSIGITMTSDSGQVRHGKLGDVFTFTAPDAEGTFGVKADYSLVGKLHSQTGFVANGSLVVEAGKFIVHNEYGPDFDLNLASVLGVEGDFLYSKTLPAGGLNLGPPLYVFDQTFALGGIDAQHASYHIEVVATPEVLGLWPFALTTVVMIWAGRRTRIH